MATSPSPRDTATVPRKGPGPKGNGASCESCSGKNAHYSGLLYEVLIRVLCDLQNKTLPCCIYQVDAQTPTPHQKRTAANSKKQSKKTTAIKNMTAQAVLAGPQSISFVAMKGGSRRCQYQQATLIPMGRKQRSHVASEFAKCHDIQKPAANIGRFSGKKTNA